MRTFVWVLLAALACSMQAQNSEAQEIRKIKDVVVYEDPKYYVAFPSVVKSGKDYVVAFRRAPNRLGFCETFNMHCDPNSYLVLVRSKDGEHWTKTPELIYAHPFGGSQDPCLLKLRDGTLLCTSYGWAHVREDAVARMKQPVYHEAGYVPLGGYILRSFDKGKSWEGPIYPPAVDGTIYYNALGELEPAYNRGMLCESKSGRIFWDVARADDHPLTKTSNHLLYSDDKGLTWHYSAVIASDPKYIFNEASMYETPKGDLVAFIRTENPETQACIARSSDGGKTFKWESMGFYGHPLTAIRLPDKRVLLTYGYRKKPCGVRARILNAECTDFASSKEFVLRDDNGPGTDVGYSWPVLLNNNRVLVVYYITRQDGLRYIGGTIIEIKDEKG